MQKEFFASEFIKVPSYQKLGEAAACSFLFCCSFLFLLSVERYKSQDCTVKSETHGEGALLK